MTGPTCPAEGCNYNDEGEKTAASVRRHINAKTDDAHSDTEALRSALNRPAEEGDEGAEQGDQGAPDDPDDEEQGKSEEERAEAAENEENDQQEMDQSSEYEQQVAQSTGTTTTNEGTETEGQQGDDASKTSSGRGVPVWAIVGGLALVALLLVVRSGDDQQDDQLAEVESEVVEETEQADPVADDPEAEVKW
ncbi:hypothetical protein [Haloarcula sp. H-GB5]